MLLTIIGSALGGLFRLAPEVLGLFRSARDADHEYRMAQLSAQSRERLAEVGADAGRDAGELRALVEAVKAQGAPTGVAWVDALSATVRPVATYWWLGLYTACKAVALAGAVEAAGAQAALAGAWGTEDQAMLASILSYWFVDRTLRKHPIR